MICQTNKNNKKRTKEKYINNLNQLFRENEQYKKEGIFIPPTMYDAARAAGGPMRQVDALKYMIGSYKDGELVKNDAL